MAKKINRRSNVTTAHPTAAELRGITIEINLTDTVVPFKDIYIIRVRNLNFCTCLFLLHLSPPPITLKPDLVAPHLLFPRLFILFLINGSWQKRFTAENAENRRGLLFFSACPCALCDFFESSQKIIKSLLFPS